MEDLQEFFRQMAGNDIDGVLYHDETNNFRKLILTERGSNNEAENMNFVLGGIGSLTRDAIDCSVLFSDLRLQPSVKEIKFKHFTSGKTNFIDILKSAKLRTLFKWIKADKNLFFHYSSVNYVFYALIDIIDEALRKYDESVYFAVHLQLKSVLYDIIKPDLNNFLKQLYAFNYPNIKDKDVKQFAEFVLDYIEVRQSMELNIGDDFMTEFLRQTIKALRKDSSLLFLSGNQENELYSGSASSYTTKILAFEKAHLIFDREMYVEPTVASALRGYTNFEFKDSKEDIMLQISDVIVGFASKLWTYAESVDSEELKHDIKAMTKEQKETLILFFDIENRSNELCEILFSHAQPFSAIDKMGLLEMLVRN